MFVSEVVFTVVFHKAFINGPFNEAPSWQQLPTTSLERWTEILWAFFPVKSLFRYRRYIRTEKNIYLFIYIYFAASLTIEYAAINHKELRIQ